MSADRFHACNAGFGVDGSKHGHPQAGVISCHGVIAAASPYVSNRPFTSED